MHQVILQLPAPEGIDDYDGIRRFYDIAADAADPEYGLRMIRPGQRLVAMRVNADIAGRLRAELYGEHAGRTAGVGGVRVALVH